MGCNCNKSRQQFQVLVQNSTQPPTPVPMSRAERIRLRGLRIEARNKRIEDRNAAILASKIAQEKAEKEKLITPAFLPTISH